MGCYRPSFEKTPSAVRYETLESRTMLNAVPVGPEFLVNNTTLASQLLPVVAADASGDFVVAWESQVPTGGSQIIARRFDAGGAPQGGEFRIDSGEPGNFASYPAVAMDDDGDFVVTWTDTTRKAIWGQRYNAAGEKAGPVLSIAGTLTNSVPSHVTMDADGDFAVVFANLLGVYSAQGLARGGAVLTSSPPPRPGIPPDPSIRYPDVSVAMDGAGNITAAWIEVRTTGAFQGAYTRQFDVTGAALGPATLVSFSPPPRDVEIAKNSAGQTVLVVNTLGGMYANGALVSEGDREGTRAAAVAVAEDGSFVVSFERTGPFGTAPVFPAARCFDAAGKALGDEFVLPGIGTAAALAPTPGGGFVAVAARPSPIPEHGTDVYVRRFAPPAKPAAVDRVYVRGTDWSGSYRGYLEATGVGSSPFGYAAGGTHDPLPLPHLNLNQVSIDFTRDVDVDRDDLVVTGVRNGRYPFSDFDYDDDRHVATWTFDRNLPADRLALTLDAPDVHHAFNLNVVPGDADRNGRVNALDLAAVRARQGTTAGSLGPGPTAFYIRTMDLNGDGRINALDLTAVRRTLNQSLPAPATSLLR